MSSPEDLHRRWQVVLTYHGGSAKLWKEYLRWQRSQYGMFDVPKIRASYQNAVQVSHCMQQLLYVYLHSSINTVHSGMSRCTRSQTTG